MPVLKNGRRRGPKTPPKNSGRKAAAVLYVSCLRGPHFAAGKRHHLGPAWVPRGRGFSRGPWLAEGQPFPLELSFPWRSLAPELLDPDWLPRLHLVARRYEEAPMPQAHTMESRLCFSAERMAHRFSAPRPFTTLGSAPEARACWRGAKPVSRFCSSSHTRSYYSARIFWTPQCTLTGSRHEFQSLNELRLGLGADPRLKLCGDTPLHQRCFAPVLLRGSH